MKAPRDAMSHPTPLLRKKFNLRGTVRSAILQVSGLGYCEPFVNGHAVSDHVLEPAQTTYDVRAFYVTHDITALLHDGENAIGLWLGNGFFGQNTAFAVDWLAWGKPCAIAKLVITYSDGEEETLVTDATWRAFVGPIVFDNVYFGETYDATREQPGWATADFDDYDWRYAAEIGTPTQAIVAQTIPPMKRVHTVVTQRVTRSSDNKFLFDFGQNLAGWVRLKVTAPRGTTITMRFAERLTSDGTRLEPDTTGVFATGAVQTLVYVCKGGGEEIYEPRFTYFGFRYAEVTGLPGEPREDLLQAIHVRTAVETRGTFSCSDELLNRIYTTSLWTLESNLHGTAEDCPHREKCGWLGDAHAVGEFAIFNFDMNAFWAKFMADVETTKGRGVQTYLKVKAEPGLPCNIALGRRLCEQARPDWGVAVVLVPYYLWLYYGNDQVVRDHFPLMQRWIEYVNGIAVNHIVEQGYGDWCPPDGKMESPVPLTSTALHYEALRIMTTFAKLLGHEEESQEYARLAKATRAAYVARFFNVTDHTFGSQTANAISLRLGLVPEDQHAAVAAALVADINETHAGHLHVGIHGGRHLLTALCDADRDDVAFAAMKIAGYPGFVDQFDRGLTTWPEQQNNRPRGEFTDQSLNHPMQAGFAAFFHECVAGIRPRADGPGFTRFDLRPSLYRQLTHASATHDTPHGRIESAWTSQGGVFEWTIVVPPNTQATAWPPPSPGGTRESQELSPGRHVLRARLK